MLGVAGRTRLGATEPACPSGPGARRGRCSPTLQGASGRSARPRLTRSKPRPGWQGPSAGPRRPRASSWGFGPSRRGLAGDHPRAGGRRANPHRDNSVASLVNTHSVWHSVAHRPKSSGHPFRDSSPSSPHGGGGGFSLVWVRVPHIPLVSVDPHVHEAPFEYRAGGDHPASWW